MVRSLSVVVVVVALGSSAPARAGEPHVPPLFAKQFVAGASWRFNATDDLSFQESENGPRKYVHRKKGIATCAVKQRKRFAGNVVAVVIKCKLPAAFDDPGAVVPAVWIASGRGVWIEWYGEMPSAAAVKKTMRGKPNLPARYKVGHKKVDRGKTKDGDSWETIELIRRSKDGKAVCFRWKVKAHHLADNELCFARGRLVRATGIGAGSWWREETYVLRP